MIPKASFSGWYLPLAPVSKCSCPTPSNWNLSLKCHTSTSKCNQVHYLKNDLTGSKIFRGWGGGGWRLPLDHEHSYSAKQTKWRMLKSNYQERFIYATRLSTVQVSTVQMCQLLCGSTLLSRLSLYQHTASVKFCVPVFVHVHVVYMLCKQGRWGRSGRPGDHLTNVLTANPLFAGEKHAYRLHRSVSTQTSKSKQSCGDLKMSRFWARWPLWHSWLVLLGIHLD